MRYVPLGDLVDIKGGGTPNKKNPDYWNGGVPWASVKDIQTTEISCTADNVSKEGIANSASNLIPAGAIIVPTRMAVGKAAINTIDLAINQDLKALFPGPELNARYLLYFLLANGRLLERQASGATVKGITLDVLRRLKVPLPPLVEQQRIATILDQADALRRARRRAIDRSSDLGHSIFYEMFSELMNDPDRHESLDKHISFITSGGRGWAKYYASDGARFVRSLDVQMNKIGTDDIAYVLPPNSAEARRTKIKTGDVLLTITGSKIGRIATAPPYLDGAFVSQHVAIIRLNQCSMDPTFLSFYIGMNAGGQRQIRKQQYGQAKPGLNFEQIRAFEVPSAPLSDQLEFKRRLESLSEVGAKLEKQSAHLDHLFASLQQRAFRGEL